MNRRQARKQAFLLIFQYKFQPECMEALLENFFNENEAGSQREYIENIVKSTVANAEEIDEIINDHLNGWDIGRISSVCLAALRLGVCEMLYADDIPSVVSVNEAVAVAGEYEGGETASFVNGVMDKIKEKLG